MTIKNGYTILVLLAALFEAVFSSCKKDPAEFVLSSLMIGTIQVVASEPEVKVPVGQAISATFNCKVDPGSVVPSSIILVQEHDQAGIPLTLTVSENTITITPDKNLNFGTLFRLTFTAGIKSEGGLTLLEAYRTFTTTGVFEPEGVIAYWNFEGNARDQAGTFNPAPGGVVNIEYAASRNKAAGNAAVFDGDISIIEIPDADALMNTNSLTLSFWVKTNSAGHFNEAGKPSGHFVMGLAAFFGLEFEISDDYSSCKLVASFDAGIGQVLSEDIYFPGDGRNKDNGGWQGWMYCRDLTGSGGVQALLQDKWAHIVCKYESSAKQGTMYINGAKMKVFDFDEWPAGDARRGITGLRYRGTEPETFNELAFGFIQSRAGTFFDSDNRYGYDFPTSNHFKGRLDDVRIFHRALTETEIQLMYNSEK